MSTESTVEQRNTSRRGTKTTEVILGSAAARLESGLKSLSGVVESVAKLEEKINQNALFISDQEATIAAKGMELRNLIAQNKIELQQAYEANKEGFVRGWLLEKDYQIIKSADLVQLRNDLTAAKADTNAQINREVAIVTNTLNRNHESAKKEYELEFKAKEAQNVAALAQKDDKIKFLEEQVASWKKALDDEREASVKRAQAAQIQNLNVMDRK